MGWYEELQKTFRATAGQIKGSEQSVQTAASSRKDEIFFTKNAQAKMKAWGIAEKMSTTCTVTVPL